MKETHPYCYQQKENNYRKKHIILILIFKIIIKTYYIIFQIFRVFDINNDGTVSQKELQRIGKKYVFKK